MADSGQSEKIANKINGEGVEEDDFDLGQRLRSLRELHNLSQRELAKRVGVSNAVISLIEQNRTNPSVGMLKKVLGGIPMSMNDFFALDVAPREKVFFKSEELTEIAGGKISFRQVGRDLTGKSLQILRERYQPGADTGDTMLRHEGEESGVIIRGRFEVTVGEQRRVLGPGDAFYFDSRIPHRFRNIGDEEVEVITACTPPSF